MERAEYLDLVAKGYEGEIFAAAGLDAVAERFGREHPFYDAIRLLADLEWSNAGVMAPVMRRHALPMPDEAAVRAAGTASLKTMQQWPEMMAALRGIMPAVVESYDALAQAADPADKAALSHFAEHEHLLLNLAVNEEKPDALALRVQVLAQVRDLIDRARALPA